LAHAKHNTDYPTGRTRVPREELSVQVAG